MPWFIIVLSFFDIEYTKLCLVHVRLPRFARNEGRGEINYYIVSVVGRDRHVLEAVAGGGQYLEDEVVAAADVVHADVGTSFYNSFFNIL